MITFNCKCGQKCVATGEVARANLIKLCSECEEKAETHDMKPAPALNVAAAIQQEFLT
jgi:hypothetical protein